MRPHTSTPAPRISPPTRMTPGERRASAIFRMPWSSRPRPRRSPGVVSVCAVHRVPIVPRGAGTGYAAGASPSHGGVILSLARLNRVLGVESEALRLHAQAGAITAGIHAQCGGLGPVLPAGSGLVRAPARSAATSPATPPARTRSATASPPTSSPGLPPSSPTAGSSASARAATPRRPGCSRSWWAPRGRSG